MQLKTYFKKYFISDVIIMTILAGLLYLPARLFAGETGVDLVADQFLENIE